MTGEKLKMKTTSLTLGLNNPENPGTNIEFNVWLGGKSHVAQRNAMHGRYHGSS